MMAQSSGLIIVTLLLRIALAADDPIPFHDNDDVKFKEWLNTLYNRVEINPQTLATVKTYVERETKKITDKIKTIDDCFDFAKLRGSTAEGLRVYRPDEFDFTLVNNAWKGKIVFEETGEEKGFAYAKQVQRTCLDNLKLDDHPNAIDPDKVRKRMEKLVKDALSDLQMTQALATVVITGPAINFKLPKQNPSDPWDYIDIDLALSISQANWPTTARKDLPQALKDQGVGLVPKVLPQTPGVWQISFSALEFEIFRTIDQDNGIRKKVLKIAKYLKQKSNWPIDVASFHLKTILMKMNRDRPSAADWTEDKLVPRFRELINGILTATKQGQLESFFVPGDNLLRHKPPLGLQEAAKAIKNMIDRIYNDPNSLFPEDDPCRRCKRRRHHHRRLHGHRH